MADLDTTDPTSIYTADYLAGVAATPIKPRRVRQEEMPLPTEDNMLMGNARNLLGMLSPQYQAQRNMFSKAQPENNSTLMYSPNPSQAMGMARLGKDATVDDVRELIKQAESKGDYTIFNQGGYYGGKASRASGAYQYIPSTWNGYGGYTHAAFAPPKVQDAKMNEDLARRAKKYEGDIFKVIAEHYLPAQANRPDLWGKPAYVGKTKVMPVAEYIAKVVKGSPLEESWNVYSGKRQQTKPSSAGATR